MSVSRHLLPLAVVALVSSLGACGPDLSTPEGRCEAQAYDDPTYKEELIKSFPDYGDLARNGASPAKDAFNAAKLRCLRSLGLAPKGGVERVRP